MKLHQQKIISLDLETTHLDMREGRIMEIGAVEVEIVWDRKKKQAAVKFGNEFSTLINPEITPSPTALALTGITLEEINAAPAWREQISAFRDFLGDSMLLGHNVMFDILYLKNQGLNLKNVCLDTLELSQTFLPLLTSHSLEFLSQEAEVSGLASHRALSDSKSSALVAAFLLNQFNALKPELKNKIKEIAGSSTLVFRELIDRLPNPEFTEGANTVNPAQNTLDLRLPNQKKIAVNSDKILPQGLVFADKSLYAIPVNFPYWEGRLAREVLDSDMAKAIIAVSNPVYLTEIPPDFVVANPSRSYCEIRFQRLLERDDISDLLKKLAIKLFILRETHEGWDLSRLKMTYEERKVMFQICTDPGVCQRHECGFALSLKNIGLDKQNYFLDTNTLFELSRKWKMDFISKSLVMFNVGKVQDEFAETAAEVWNLRRIRNLISIVYPIDPDVAAIKPRVSKQAEEIVNELDMFFGILHLSYLKREGDFAENILVNKTERDSERFAKMFHPAQKLANKLLAFSEHLRDELPKAQGESTLEMENLRSRAVELAKFIDNIFVNPAPSGNIWFRFNADWVDLNLSKTSLPDQWSNFEKGIKSLSMIDLELPNISRQYYLNTLGLSRWHMEKLQLKTDVARLTIIVSQKDKNTQALIAYINTLPGKVIVILPGEAKLKDLFTALSQNGAKKREILAYKFSGNISMLEKKADLVSDCFLLLTLNAVVKYFRVLPEAEHLVIIRLPFEAPGGRPLIDVMYGQNNFADHQLPRAVALLHSLILKFLKSGSGQKTIHILDSRAIRSYDRTFLAYLQEFSQFHVIESSE